ncbi:MAG: redoxin domain-containing protein, partial [Deltaproteobacteria bacterium]|nr:redoxin domain-containing protein [Deltaproteobacteria bacterium]
MGDNTIDVSDSTFEAAILNSDKPALVDFWASWCAPCKAIAPIVEALAEEFSGQVVVAKMNVDDNPSTPGKYGV